MKSPTSTRRILLRLTGLALALAAGAAFADSESFPNRPITIIVPYSAGTGSDTLARAIGQAVADKSHQSVVVENHDGGGSLVGTLAAARARPDGYTILIVANPFVIGPTQRNPPPYDPIKDFQPIAKVAIIPLVLASSVSLPVKSVGELVAYARANPGKLSYASSGPGTISQQEMEVFKSAAGLDIVEVGYKSTAQALTDLIGGHVPLFPVVVSSVLQHLKAGRIHVLGVFDAQRSPLIPDIPSMSEALGVPGYTPTPVWYGFVAPAGTPREAMQALTALFQGAMQTQAVKDRLTELGAQPIGPSNEQFVADMKAETAKAAQLFKRASASAAAVEGKAKP